MNRNLRAPKNNSWFQFTEFMTIFIVNKAAYDDC